MAWLSESILLGNDKQFLMSLYVPLALTQSQPWNLLILCLNGVEDTMLRHATFLGINEDSASEYCAHMEQPGAEAPERCSNPTWNLREIPGAKFRGLHVRACSSDICEQFPVALTRFTRNIRTPENIRFRKTGATTMDSGVKKS